MTTQDEHAGIPDLLDWANAIAFIANHYRQSFSPGTLHATAEWATQKALPDALKHLARHAGLNCQFLSSTDQRMSAWRLPLVIQLRDGQIAVIESFDVNNAVGLRFVKELSLLSHCPLENLLPEIAQTIAFRPAAPEKDIRTESYLTRFRPDWLRKIVLKDIRPYMHVMLASLAINVLALSGILFSMQVYDRVIPAQSYPTLYVLFSGVVLAAIFAFILKIMRGHVTDLLGKRGDIRVSDRVFGHALRLKNTAVPSSTGSFISQIRELEQVREMMTSTMMTIVADLPFFLLFQLVLFIVSPWLSWIAPVATILMLLPGLLLQRKLAALANKNQHENTLRNAILVESIQGLQDIKMMQAESRFLHQWNSYIAITAESGVKTRRLTHGLVSWGMSVQNLLYATVVMVGAPLVINGDITTGAMVAASMLSTRMVAPMTALCGVLARWQQVKTAKASLDNLMALPVEGGQDEPRIHRAVLHGNFEFRQAEFRYGANDGVIPLRINQLSIKAGEKIAILGRIGAGKSTLLQAMMGNVELVSGELRLDDLSLPQIDLADIRRNATLLTQEARLFHGSLRENLLLGRPAATDDEIVSVLTLCSALEFVRKLPLGLEHIIMEGGLGLSGGQRQSLLLARTLLRDPNIILLDEPTSFFDERTEKVFVEQLAEWAGERTMIIATHKAAVLNIVDRILVIQDGHLALDKPKTTVFEQEKARGQVVNI
ncbi:ATP-binding cassette subfamily C protein LapB [Raoultella ornithinolytica]|uniref:ATP-binding cassette subfamily C protein LapB n=1 Tax=Raoultella ornithinolytica TaxID=54291 RepID=A0ABD7QRN2_RAOOR|nr:ATP-binding cassette subfamily C protein LapB [Raoultella ornithinolytica]